MEYLNDLTEVQREAVTHVEGPLLVLAGPGSGKTRVVTSRVAHLLHQEIRPHNLLALTFTNKAADEMRLRLDQLAPGNPVWMSTFHRFCSRLLRRHAALVGLHENFRIYDADDSQKALKSVIEDLEIPLRRFTPSQIARTISNAKNELATAEQFQSMASRPLEVLAAEIYPVYQQRLVSSNAVDFDDLLMHVALLLRENPELRGELDNRYRYILVDEYQDTNLAQYTIVRALSIDHPNLSVTGDPDQSIYAWRGADINNILEFERDYPQVRVVRLEQNYRSTKRILQAADQLISNNVYRKQKSLFTDNPQGDAVRLVRYFDGEEEAADIARQVADDVRLGLRRPRDVAILFRTNALSRNLEHALREYGVPYQMVNGVEFYQRREIKDVLAYLHLINNPQDDIALLRIINTPARGIGKKSLQMLRDFALRHQAPLLEACREATRLPELSPRIAKAIEKFVAVFDSLCEAAAEPVEAIVGRVLMQTGYLDHLKDSSAEEDQQRLANVEELVTAAKQFDAPFDEGGRLEEFLEQTSLVADTDAWDAESDRATLMTLHAAKGLEFPSIYIIAVEEGILPHERSRNDLRQTEEERRLLFVGMTRAKQNLQLSTTQKREYRGRRRGSVPSSFLMELPRHEMECYGSKSSLPQQGPRLPRDHETIEEEVDELAREWAEQQRGDAWHAETTVDRLERRSRSATSRNSPATPMRTAAQLLSGDDDLESSADKVAPESFELGMLVAHPEYGPGKIIALSGRGEKRFGTIQFLHPPEKRKFCLKFSQLQPIGSP